MIKLKYLTFIIIFSFFLSPSLAQAFSFAVISDTPELNTDAQGEALKNVIPLINEKKPDFVVLLGDLSYKGSTAQFNEFNSVFLSKLTVPVVPVAGNHDFLKGPNDWYKFWGGQTSKLLAEYNSRTKCGSESPSRFSSFTYKGQGFVFIDPYFNGHGYYLSQKELDCLDTNMKAGDLVFRHVTPYGLSCAKDGSVCGSSVLGKSVKGNKGEVQNYEQLTDKLISKNAKALFSGHTHAHYHGTCDGLEYINSGTMGKQMMEYTIGQSAADIEDSFVWVNVDESGKINVTMYIYNESSKTFAPQTKKYPATVVSKQKQSQHSGYPNDGFEIEGVNATCVSIQPGGSSSGSGTSSTPDVVQEIKTFTPKLEINIPQLEFTDIENTLDSEGYIHVPFIGEYMSAIYKVAMVAISIIGVIMIIVVGVKITVLGGEERVNGFKKIGQIIIGLFIAWGSYAILYNINPDLVNFQSLKIKYIEPILLPNYEEGPDSIGGEGKWTGEYDSAGLEQYKKVSDAAKCAMGIFDLHIGKTPPLTSITFFGISGVKVNTKSVHAWKAVESILSNSNDPEIKEYIQYLKDLSKLKAPSLHPGAKDGLSKWKDDAGGSLQNSCGVGYKRKTKSTEPCVLGKAPLKDMHQPGLAIDIAYSSNWDFNVKENPKACTILKTNYEKYKDLWDKYPLTSKRIEKSIEDCINNFANGTKPFTTHPQLFIDTFKQNGFIWGGNFGEKNTFRTDGMHFEYWGECQKVYCGNRGSNC